MSAIYAWNKNVSNKQPLCLICVSWISVGEIFDFVAPSIYDNATTTLVRRDAVARSTEVQNLKLLAGAAIL
jgi:hypothetical protein